MKRYSVVLAEDGPYFLAWMGNAVSVPFKWWQCVSVHGPKGHTSPCQQSGRAGSPWLAVGSLWSFEGTDEATPV